MGGGKEILIEQAKVLRRRVVKGGGGFFAFFFIYSRKRERERQVRGFSRVLSFHMITSDIIFTSIFTWYRTCCFLGAL